MIRQAKLGFHNPAFGQDNKTHCPVGVPEHVNGPLAGLGKGRAQFFTSMASIATPMLEPWKKSPDPGDCQRHTTPVLNVSRVKNAGSDDVTPAYQT